MTLQTLIKPLKLNYVNSDITDKNFPYVKQEKGEFELLHFDKDISTEDALKEIDKRGFRPATIHEMLEWAKDNWKGEAIVTFGSVWQSPYGFRYVGCLCYYDDRRELSLYWIGYDWHDRCRFAAVRKSSDTRKLGSPGQQKIPSTL